MRKSKLYLILAIITSLTLFTTAAICNQCAAASVEEAVEEEGGETLEPDEEEAAEEEEPAEEESEAEEAAEEEEEVENIETEAPTINLEIYEGPTYSSSDDVCYYRIKAIVTGKPTPTVEFSKDDSGGAWGSKKVQINLNDPSDTYNLKATATNSEGTATDSITLDWGCPIPNNPPEISEITLMGNHYIGFEYTISAAATDIDGDSITYSWSVDGGSLNNPNVNPVKWKIPNTAGSYNITVIVDDGNGGQDEKTETVEVLAMPSVSLPQIPGGGAIEEGGSVNVCLSAVVGDSTSDRPYRGFLNFDISSLAGKEVISAEIKFNHYFINHDPYPLIEKIWVAAVYWGTDNIKLEDYSSLGDTLGGYDIPAFTCSSQALVDVLNQAIDNGHDRFQIRLSHTGYKTDHDGLMDYITYGGHQYPAEFNVSYVP